MYGSKPSGTGKTHAGGVVNVQGSSMVYKLLEYLDEFFFFTLGSTDNLSTFIQYADQLTLSVIKRYLKSSQCFFPNVIVCIGPIPVNVRSEGYCPWAMY